MEVDSRGTLLHLLDATEHAVEVSIEFLLTTKHARDGGGDVLEAGLQGDQLVETLLEQVGEVE